MIIERNIAHSLLTMITKYPVIALTGPRQSGKTTLLKDIFSEYDYVSLENPDNRAFADSDPNGFLLRYASKVIIDEAQRVPHLFSYIQTKVDESNEMGQYILSGSQNFHLMQEITQSLAGRVAIFKLFPFDLMEMKKGGILNNDYLENLITGFYPAIFDRKIKHQTYYSNYIQTYIQRDVSQIIGIRDQNSFKKFLGIVATRAGQLLNLNDIAREVGITQPTAKSWLSALESSYIVFSLQPYHENSSKRVVKTPKLYFYDTGLLCFLLKIKQTEDLYTHCIKGNLFENLIIAEYFKRMHHLDEINDLWFWRDSHGNEVDLLYFKENDLYITEIKANQTIMPRHFKGLSYFEKHAKSYKLIKQLVYAGNENHERNLGKVVSWKDLLY
ncbi:MAG: ATP-binding protein [Bacteroidetes bacterium]|nr:ATP-binding protein [Bacteroidota bacterium]